MAKPRLLIPISIQFCVRYLLRTGLLERIAEYAHPVLLMGWQDDELQQEIAALGAEVHRLPEARWGDRYTRLRSVAALWHRRCLASPSSAIDHRRGTVDQTLRSRARQQLRDGIFQAGLLLPGSTERLLASERRLFWDDTNAAELRAALDRLRIDAALSLTPFLKDEQMVMRVCAEQRLPLCAAILSFDNLTTRSWIPVLFDHYLLWNRHNAAELVRGYPAAANREVTLVGPAQFDFYRDPSYLWDEADWRSRLGLPTGRPVILFAAGHHAIVPHEPHWLGQLDEAIEREEIPSRPIVLFRRHPVDPPERWLPVLAQARHVVSDDPWPAGRVMGQTNVRRADIEKLASTLCHSQVHVNASSTMTVDGAIFDRPQIGPAYDDRHGQRYDRIVRELYLREHYLPITRSGGLAVVRSRVEMVEAIRTALKDPRRGAEGRRRMVDEICTYADGRCTHRVDEALRRFLAERTRSPAEAGEAVGALIR